ncbi:Uncharacterised protein [Mycobacteroides abscessus]|nr:Uncharacterised protein [Mycobacteroides abscessus]
MLASLRIVPQVTDPDGPRPRYERPASLRIASSTAPRKFAVRSGRRFGRISTRMMRGAFSPATLAA